MKRVRKVKDNKLLKVLSVGFVTTVVLGGAIAFSIPAVQSKIADNLVEKSSIYQSVKDENGRLKDELDNKTVEYGKIVYELTTSRENLATVNENLETARAQLETANNEKATLQTRLNVEIEAKENLQAQLDEANADKENLQNQLNTVNADKVALQGELDTANATIETLNSQIEAKDTSIASLTADLNTANARIETLEANVQTLTNERNSLQATVTSLNEQVTVLQTEIDDLQAQLDEYEQYRVTIDQTNPVEAIIVTNTKDGTIYALQNPETITTLKLYSWEDVSIKYAEADNLKIFVNGVEQDNLTVTLNGSNNENIEILTVIVNEPVAEPTNISKFTFNGNTLTKYIGDDTDVVIPSSYSLGDIVNVEKIFDDIFVLENYCMENGYNFSFNKDGELITVSSNVELFTNEEYINDIINTNGQIIVNFIVQKYIDGNDFIVTTIGDRAFANKFITSITIPNSITTIGDLAFQNCVSLTSINIPDRVVTIYGRSFQGCDNLTSIIVSPNNKVYDSRDNCNAIIETSTNVLVVGCKNTIIPNNVTTIGDMAFIGRRSITSINIPDSITTIGSDAFCSCNSLVIITIPNSVTTIGRGAFLGCNSLRSIQFNGTVEEWNAITKGTDWHISVPATEVVCTDGTVTL